MREVPRIIAFCGNPTSGKSIAAEIVSEIYGHSHLDDGLPLRKIAMAYLGLTEHQVFTQEGKLERVMLNGREWTVRQILGELGNVFEEKFGADIIPLMSLNTRAPDERLVCSAVRREQGRFWREQGALVLEIINPLAGPSPYEFDYYNPAHCHAQVVNDGLARGLSKEDARKDLADKLVSVIEGWC
ncbi:hypothetical protein GCM10023174_10530 [Chelativorans composti]|uniref:Uncharacterized protein n=1 Tax=Chelativorans composti TaxID=768533 RepID=A0ABW5DKK1_9HYPH